MNYQIITDKNALINFIDWLPDLKKHETFYLCLFARSKYCKNIIHLKSDKSQLKRFTSNKERMLHKIMQLECPMGSYTSKGVGTGQIEVPQESLALYITTNPRNLIHATKESLHKLINLNGQPYNGYNPHAEVISEIQKNKSKTRITTYDFDVDKNKWNNIWIQICSYINPNAVDVIETRGGYHVLVRVNDVEKRFEKSWYNNLSSVLAMYSSDMDNFGDIMSPVVGTYQGGHTPKFL